MLSLFIYHCETPLGWKDNIQENNALSLFY